MCSVNVKRACEKGGHTDKPKPGVTAVMSCRLQASGPRVAPQSNRRSAAAVRSAGLGERCGGVPVLVGPLTVPASGTNVRRARPKHHDGKQRRRCFV